MTNQVEFVKLHDSSRRLKINKLPDGNFYWIKSSKIKFVSMLKPIGSLGIEPPLKRDYLKINNFVESIKGKTESKVMRIQLRISPNQIRD